ncbi:hypothetical protein DICPUDRAFT_13896, partial [Dictyostelium purpureum]
NSINIISDGYQWRKYGQKNVKGSSHPRHYYKCTYPGCNVRKQVERVSNGSNTNNIVYKGEHCHGFP